MNTWGLDADLCVARYGIVFLGTPHRGGKKARFASMVSRVVQLIFRHPSNSLLKSVEKESIFAEILNETFANQYERYQFISVYQTLTLWPLCHPV